MTVIKSIPSGHAAELRMAFDQSFADPIQAAAHETVNVIAIRLAGHPHAIRMAEIAGLFVDVKVTPCPSPLAEFRGIAGFRGTLTPVYDLAVLLGYPKSPGRWLALAKGGALGLVFDTYDGHFRIEPAAIAAPQGPASARHVSEIARQAGTAWPVIDIASVVAAIATRAAATSSQKEH